MKRIGAAVAALIVMITAVAALALPAAALDPPDITGVDGALLYNFENDVTLYEQNADEVIYPASTVKLMTGILAIEALGNDPDRVITVTADMLKGVVGNNIGLVEGEKVTVADMLNALLVGGANDAAQVLAITVAGSVDAFVLRMNARAAELGAVNTRYANPTGMHDEAMFTTVRDTAIIAKHCAKIPYFMSIVAEPKYVMNATNKSDYRNVYNRNYLIAKNTETRYFYNGATGMNAGSTTQAGFAVVATATRAGLTYLAVAMGGIEDESGALTNYVAARKMLDWAFGGYGYISVLSDKTVICEIPVTLSSSLDYVTLVPAQSLELYLPTDTNVGTDVTYSYKTISDSLTAPVELGQKAGMITVILNGEIIGTVDLVTTSGVSRSDFLYTMEGIKRFATSRFFIATVVSAVVISVAYVIINSIVRYRRMMKQRRYR